MCKDKTADLNQDNETKKYEYNKITKDITYLLTCI